MQKSTIAFVAISLALALCVLYLWQQLRDEREAFAQRGEQQALEVVRDPPATRSVATTGSEPTVSAPAATPPPVRTVPDARLVNPRCGIMVGLYPDLARQLGLSPEQELAVCDIVSQQQTDVLAVSVVRGADGQISEEQTQRARAEVWQRHNADLAAYLGPATWEQFQEYETTLEARRRVKDLSWVLPEQLTESQKEALINDMQAEQQRLAQEDQLRTYPNMDQRAKIEAALQNLKGREASDQRIMNSARVYLTPAQLPKLQEFMTLQIQSKRKELNAQLAQLNGGR